MHRLSYKNLLIPHEHLHKFAKKSPGDPGKVFQLIHRVTIHNFLHLQEHIKPHQ